MNLIQLRNVSFILSNFLSQKIIFFDDYPFLWSHGQRKWLRKIGQHDPCVEGLNVIIDFNCKNVLNEMTFLQLNIIDFVLRNQFTSRGGDGRVYGHVITKFWLLVSGFSLPYFTCAVNAVSGISWFACTNVRAFSVVTESIGAAVMPSCLTLVYVCNIVNRMHWLI